MLLHVACCYMLRVTACYMLLHVATCYMLLHHTGSSSQWSCGPHVKRPITADLIWPMCLSACTPVAHTTLPTISLSDWFSLYSDSRIVGGVVRFGWLVWGTDLVSVITLSISIFPSWRSHTHTQTTSLNSDLWNWQLVCRTYCDCVFMCVFPVCSSTSGHANTPCVLKPLYYVFVVGN